MPGERSELFLQRKYEKYTDYVQALDYLGLSVNDATDRGLLYLVEMAKSELYRRGKQ